jgi:acetyl-CoA synthetase
MTTADEPEGATDAAAADGSAGTGADSAAEAGPATGSAQGGSAPAGAALVFDDPFDRPSSDDTDRGWGGGFSDSVDDDFRRFLNEKPPHHL